MKAKYLIINDSDIEVAVVFSPLIDHRRVAGAFGGTAISAGFCSFPLSEVQAYGKSVGLGKQARPEDAQIISQTLNFEI